MSTDTSEKGLESLIVRTMTGCTDLISQPCVVSDTAVPVAGSMGWLLGDPDPKKAKAAGISPGGFLEARLPFVDDYRTVCIAPEPAARAMLETNVALAG